MHAKNSFSSFNIHSKRWMSFKTQFKIEFLLPGTGSRNLLEIVTDSTPLNKTRWDKYEISRKFKKWFTFLNKVPPPPRPPCSYISTLILAMFQVLLPKSKNSYINIDLRKECFYTLRKPSRIAAISLKNCNFNKTKLNHYNV